MRANRVQKVLVTSGTEAADVSSITAQGYVGLVHGKANNTPVELGDKFQIVVGKANGQVEYSDVIDSKDIISVKIREYEPVVEQAVTVTLTAPTAGSEYLLTIVNKADKEILQRRQDKRSYQVIADIGETETTLAAKFVDFINSDTAAPVIATSAAGVITLTAKPKVVTENAAGQFGLQNYFSVGISEVNPYGHAGTYGTVAQTVAPGFGNGTYPQVRTLESESAGYVEGIYLNRTKFPVPNYPFDSHPNETYDIVVIEFDNEYNTNSVVAGKRNADPITLVLAVKTGTDNLDDLKAFLDNFI